MFFSWNNKKCFDTINARYKHEDSKKEFIVRYKGIVSKETSVIHKGIAFGSRCHMSEVAVL